MFDIGLLLCLTSRNILKTRKLLKTECPITERIEMMPGECHESHSMWCISDTLVHFQLGTTSNMGAVQWTRRPLLKLGQAWSLWPAEKERQLTHNDARSPVHLHDVRVDTFVSGIADHLGVLPHALCHRVIHDRGKAPPLCLFKIFMIFDLKKR